MNHPDKPDQCHVIIDTQKSITTALCGAEDITLFIVKLLEQGQPRSWLVPPLSWEQEEQEQERTSSKSMEDNLSLEDNL